MKKDLTHYWLFIGVTAVAIAGLFALPLAMGRSPVVSQIPLLGRLFHQALVVHVDLSVLVWFLSIACLLWSLMSSNSRQPIPCLEESALISFALGTLCIAASPFDTMAPALMSNYIPVLYSPIFFLGLALLMCGTALMLVRLFTASQPTYFEKPLQYGLYAGGVIAAISLMAFVWSFAHMPGDLNLTQYYEIGFWGGGHVLQFLHTQMLLICWWVLMHALKPSFRLKQWATYFLLSIGLAAALATPLGYWDKPVESGEHREFFTMLMIAVNGMAPLALGVIALCILWRTRLQRKKASPSRAIWAALFASVVLFLFGGALGEMIQGQNVVIPAHYHGAIVGITLGFMGIAYLLLPHFGYRDVSGWKLAYWQPLIYGFGQIMHVSGLAYSGGYGGIQRKTPGGLEHAPTDLKVAMGFMGLGGLLAIIGGLLFVVVVVKALKRETQLH